TENSDSVFPLNETMGTGYDYQAAESVYRIREMDLDNQSPNLKTFTVAARARRLDLMSAVPLGSDCLVISSRFSALLEDFNLPPHWTFPAPIVKAGKAVEGYSLLHMRSLAEVEPDMAPRQVSELFANDPLLSIFDLLCITNNPRLRGWHVSPSLAESIRESKLT